MMQWVRTIESGQE